MRLKLHVFFLFLAKRRKKLLLTSFIYIGLDDLLVGFCAGVGFSNDGWFTEKTEESHVSNVIDLLLNLAYFVYFGSIIPWDHYNAPEWGLTPWRLVVIALFVIFFRRIPIMLALKPVIPDIKTWREALFAGHFGPIGVGAIFVAILARAELETGEPTPLAVLPAPGSANYVIIEVIWPITTFLVISSIIVHGSSIAVFTLGKRINTMTISMSYTVGNDENGWLSRLPKLQNNLSRSFRKPEHESQTSSDEKLPYPHVEGGMLSPGGTGSGTASGTATPRRLDGLGRPTGRKIVFPDEQNEKHEGPYGDSRVDEDVLHEDNITAFQEGRQIVFENKEGDVVGQTTTGPPGQASSAIKRGVDNALQLVGSRDKEPKRPEPAALPDGSSHNAGPVFPVEIEEPNNPKNRKAATAYRFDDTIILEDEDGEVIKRYRIPRAKAKPFGAGAVRRRQKKTGLGKVAEWLGLQQTPGRDLERSETSDSAYPQSEYDYDGVISEMSEGEDADHNTVEDKKGKGKKKFRMHDEKGRNLSTREFLEKLKRMDAHSRDTTATTLHRTDNGGEGPSNTAITSSSSPAASQSLRKRPTGTENPVSLTPSTPVSNPSIAISPPRRGSFINAVVPSSSTPQNNNGDETAAERRRREAALGITNEVDDEDTEDENDPVPKGTVPKRGEGVAKKVVGSTIRFADSTKRGVQELAGKGKGKGPEQ